MERKRKTRAINRDLSEPIFDIATLGTELDPCHGKLYDLTAHECQECGDIEACSIVFLRRLQIRRLKEEANDRNLDLQIDRLEFEKQVRDYITAGHSRGMKRTLLVRRASKRFKIPKDQLILTYNKVIHGH